MLKLGYLQIVNNKFKISHIIDSFINLYAIGAHFVLKLNETKTNWNFLHIHS